MTTINKYLSIGLLGACILFSANAFAQEKGKQRTIEITSSFKPSLKPQQKIGFSASPAPVDSSRPILKYQIPEQNLAFAFFPSPLKPLAFQQDSLANAIQDQVYIKAGYGNFQSPFVKALASLGNGKKANGNIEAGFQSAKGKMEFQEYSRYGAKGNVWVHMKDNNVLHIYGGYNGLNTYRYGRGTYSNIVPEDSLQVKYNLIAVGAAMGNTVGGENGFSYKAQLDAYSFSDNNSGNETSVSFDVPVTKSFSENASLTVGLKGMLSKFSGNTTSFNNNQFMIPVSAAFQLMENVTLKAGIIPSWNNKQFKLLPDIELSYLMNDKNTVFQAGFKGYFAEQNYKTLASYNPWMLQPDTLSGQRNADFYVALKSNVSENLSYRLKAGFGVMENAPLFVNSGYDGRNFAMIMEHKLNHVFVGGELVYQKGAKLNWTNDLQINGYKGITQAEKAYGLLPFDLRSSLQMLIAKGLRFKTDLYVFNGAWYVDNASKNAKGKSVLDLNAGLEFDVHKKVRLWLQFNNLANQEYQRWNQYRVLGFQALGGVIFHM